MSFMLHFHQQNRPDPAGQLHGDVRRLPITAGRTAARWFPLAAGWNGTGIMDRGAFSRNPHVENRSNHAVRCMGLLDAVLTGSIFYVDGTQRMRIPCNA